MPKSSPGSAGSAEAADPASLLLDDQLCFALYAAAHRVQALYRPLLDDLGLTYPQYLVLLVLWENNDLAVTEIGDQLLLKSATLTPLLKRMEVAGLVVRTRSEVDERRVQVSLTTAGKRLKAKVQRITTSVTCAAVDASDDVEDLVARLTSLRQHLPASLD